MTSVIVGLFFIGMGVLFWRQSSRPWWLPGKTPPKVITMEQSWGRYVAPVALASGLILVVAGVASILSEQDDVDGSQTPPTAGSDISTPETDGMTRSRSLSVCGDRLAVDEALHSLAASYGEDEAAASLAVLRDVQAPVEVEREWQDVLTLAEAAQDEGVTPDDVSDRAVADAGTSSAASIDLWAVTTACDASQSSADFGCQSLEECGDQVADQPTERNASTTVIAALSTAQEWTVEYCSGLGALSSCELSTEDGGRRAYVEFSQTSDGAFFAWFARVAG